MKRYLLLFAALAVVACGDDGTEPEGPDEYVLHRADFQTLPYTVDAIGAPNCWWSLVSRGLRIGDDQFVLNYVERAGCDSNTGDGASAAIHGDVVEINVSDMNIWAPRPFLLEFVESTPSDA